MDLSCTSSISTAGHFTFLLWLQKYSRSFGTNMQRPCIKTRVDGDEVQRKMKLSNTRKTEAMRPQHAVWILGEWKEVMGRKETATASRVFLVFFENVGICVNSKNLVAKWFLFPSLFFHDSISYLSSKHITWSLAAETEAHKPIFVFWKTSWGWAETWLTKQAFNFRFRNVERWAWKGNGEANQRGDKFLYCDRRARASCSPCVQYHLQEPETPHRRTGGTLVDPLAASGAAAAAKSLGCSQGSHVVRRGKVTNTPWIQPLSLPCVNRANNPFIVQRHN